MVSLARRILEAVEKALHPSSGLVPQPDPSEPWVSEQGSDYAVPQAILNHPDLADMSWKNDAAPSFGIYDDETEVAVRLWVDHPDPDQREAGGSRFAVTVTLADGSNADEDQVETDDVNEAIKAWERLVAKHLPQEG